MSDTALRAALDLGLVTELDAQLGERQLEKAIARKMPGHDIGEIRIAVTLVKDLQELAFEITSQLWPSPSMDEEVVRPIIDESLNTLARRFETIDRSDLERALVQANARHFMKLTREQRGELVSMAMRKYPREAK